MNKTEESNDLQTFRKILTDEKLNPKNVIEFFCTNDNLEALKEKIRRKNKEQCFFFTKEEGNELHVIALINIKIEKSGNEKTLKVINNIKEKTFQQSSFSPTGLVFNNRKISTPAKKSPKTNP